MNPRCPTVTLTAAESARLVDLVHRRGPKQAALAVGIYDERTVIKAAFRQPVSRQTADIIRHSLDRI